jgi:hypothetical protein
VPIPSDTSDEGNARLTLAHGAPGGKLALLLIYPKARPVRIRQGTARISKFYGINGECKIEPDWFGLTRTA